MDQSLHDSLLFAQRGKRRERDMDRLLKRHRVHDLVTRGHDQRRATTLVQAAKPPGIKMVLGPGKEFALIVPPRLNVAAPAGWSALAIERVRVDAR